MKIDTKFGYIFFERKGGYYWITQIESKIRFHGFGKRLLKYIPKKCMFLVYPNLKNKMDEKSLANFYLKNGSVVSRNKNGNLIDYRNISPKFIEKI